MGQVWSKKSTATPPAVPEQPQQQQQRQPTNKAPLPNKGSGNGSSRPADLSLTRKMTVMAEETKAELTKKATIVLDETRAVLERNNTVVSMSSTGAHTFSDAGIHLPHELHLPKTGLSHEANSALGAVTAAAVAAGVVSPIMTVIDLSIIKSQFQKVPMGQAIKQTAGDLFGGRARWQPALGIMSGVYFSTYMVANGTEAWCTEHGIDYKIPTAVATSLTNIVAIAYKDREFARMQAKMPTSFPKASYLLMGMRDGMTVTSSFVLKNMFRDYLVDEHDMSHGVADLAASFTVPMLAQLPATPLHILAMDLYARQNVTLASRVAEVAKGYASVTSGRIMRIIPAFGIGGLLNDMVKESFEDEEESMFLHMDQPPHSKK